MTEVERILDQYDRAMHGDAWHGEPIWQILEGISAEQAAHRPLAQRHTIWEIVAHMTFWETEVHRRINKLPPGSVESLNFPAMPAPTEQHWRVTLDQFRRSNADFRNTLSQFDPSRLDEVLRDATSQSMLTCMASSSITSITSTNRDSTEF